ncbi:TrbG/VirB9 family P-type conjugative transfer protein (plasmid) [Skermanella rosea]|uniref:TrbG/VirB9 family P-type conjugative transfer protein n=1 Tax=Skermanella rosea TaxID=1817965 RepID=UPI001933E753|nr:TrbG/VirB9 family P-type conjugative transfer protein [Skermanella rosea]UEM08207.1 TrbG/VirB9 family P-type conjugative transfer protein [Skermanella rosea]
MRIARLIGTMGAVLALSACAATPDVPAPDMVQAQPAPQPATPPLILTENPVKPEKISKDPLAAVRQALKDSRRSLSECSYEGARAICPWFDGHVYTMYLKAGEISTIYLNPDEKMRHHYFSKDQFFSAKEDWVGSPEGERDVLVVQAWMPGAKTKVTITTTRREYQINLITNRSDYNPSMRFVYPEQMAAGMAAPPERDVPIDPVTKIPLARLNTRYTASGQIGELRGERLQVMDDGKKTYVVFPEGVSIRPPYFAQAGGSGNNVEMTTDEAGNYIIHGVYRAAELQLGHDVIKIKRGR